MSDDALFHELDAYLQTVKQHLADNQRRRLSRQLAAGLRQRQQKRINQQKNPDGTPYAARRRATRRTQGGIRFLWNNDVRELRNWRNSRGRGGRMITGFDVERGALRSFFRADIERYLSIDINKTTKTTQRKDKMFRRLRTARFLRTSVQSDGVEVGFSGQTAAIASIHQYGETEQLGRSRVQYPARELLGLSAPDIDWMADTIVSAMQPS
ncbi:MULTISPECIES: phage virion morphogenesis protein [Dickeya]|uniref:Phage tail completion protein n=1 Tax=Dickeya aquatica TaxID=1401087 RepID=A0A375A9N0_9GAMM|nr:MULTISPECIES: phage virion morphogenesis protein [Dickeya]SLM62822.1 Phage tail completion protein [Dickeya aquatica]